MRPGFPQPSRFRSPFAYSGKIVIFAPAGGMGAAGTPVGGGGCMSTAQV